jgi:hypothetical protein
VDHDNVKTVIPEVRKNMSVESLPTSEMSASQMEIQISPQTQMKNKQKTVEILVFEALKSGLSLNKEVAQGFLKEITAVKSSVLFALS